MSEEPGASDASASVPYEASVDRYFERTGYSGSRDCTLEILKNIMWSHYKTFAFENLSIFLNQPISLELKDIEDKFISQKRGGYCFEHASLMLSILKQLGFAVTPLVGRVIMHVGVPSPNNHAILMVVIDGQKWLVDCWFGGYGSTSPLLISDDAVEHETMTCLHRLVRRGDVYLHQGQSREHTGIAVDGWEDFYTFNLIPAIVPIDYQVSSWFVETRPESFFRKNFLLAKFWQDKRCMMLNQFFKYRAVGPGSTDEDLDKRKITTQEEYLRVLREYFDLSFPEGTMLCPPGVTWEQEE